MCACFYLHEHPVCEHSNSTIQNHATLAQQTAQNSSSDFINPFLHIFFLSADYYGNNVCIEERNFQKQTNQN